MHLVIKSYILQSYLNYKYKYGNTLFLGINEQLTISYAGCYLVICINIFSVIIYTCYSGCIISYLVSVDQWIPFKSAQELLDSNQYTIDMSKSGRTNFVSILLFLNRPSREQQFSNLL